MSRSQFVETVTLPLGIGKALIPVEGISAIPYIVNPDGTTGSQANAYTDRISNTPASLVTDDSGTVSFYLDDGADYDVHFEDQQTPPRLASFIRSFHSDPIITDTGWTALVLGGGWTALAGTYAPAVRLLGTMVYLRGGVTNSSGGSVGPGATLATLPTQFRPQKQVNPRVGQSAGGATTATISTGGVITIQAAVATGTSLYLDGANFPLV